jgi:ubiquitin-protein ligase
MMTPRTYIHTLTRCDAQVLDIGAVINGLFFLFLEPNPQDPLNKEAAELMKVFACACVRACVRARAYAACV